MNSRIALFGGSFDPFHNGHLNLALSAVRECNLDKLIIMPNYISPFKTDKKVTPGPIRCDMIRKILHYDPAFTLSTWEIDRESTSYTYDTLDYFDDIYGEQIAFIIGFDSVLNIDTWYRGKEIIAKYHLITGVRPDYDDEAGFKKIDEYRELYNANITVLDLEPFRASSSEIRNRIANGEDVSDMLPYEIEEYIKQNGLYRL